MNRKVRNPPCSHTFLFSNIQVSKLPSFPLLNCYNVILKRYLFLRLTNMPMNEPYDWEVLSDWYLLISSVCIFLLIFPRLHPLYSSPLTYSSVPSSTASRQLISKATCRVTPLFSAWTLSFCPVAKAQGWLNFIFTVFPLKFNCSVYLIFVKGTVVHLVVQARNHRAVEVCWGLQ